MIEQRQIQPPPQPPSCAGSKQTSAHLESRTVPCLVTVRHRLVMKWRVFWTGFTLIVGYYYSLVLQLNVFCKKNLVERTYLK